MHKSFNRDHTRRHHGIFRLPIQLFVVVLSLTGCMMVGPDYQPVELAAPEAWHTELQEGLAAGQMDPATLAQWWSLLEDPQLSDLEERAIKGNLELKEAQARISEARAIRGISYARLFPTLDAGAAASKSRSSESGGTGDEINRYATGFDAGWEVDIFGGVRRSVEAAQANLEATQEDLNGVLVSLLAEVALNYVEVRTYQARLETTEANIGALQESYEINFSRNQAGIISELSVQESLRILESAKAIIPGLEAGLDAAKNRLAVLLGESPGSLHKELAERRQIPGLPATVMVGIPAETLRHRPDIRQAERNLAAQTARIGMATADLYPKFHLVGTLGLESIASADLFQSSSQAWGIGPSANWRIFDAGAIRQNIQVQNARQEQALIYYEATVLRAQEEVENALIAYAKEQLKRDSLAKASAAAERTELLARDQYQAGLVDFNNVLDAQRALLILHNELAQSDGIVTANLVRLYKAFGGGWVPVQAETK
ncbi:MAG: efflux transporter outer membrane subunit [Deltaproteobacteria bacterium]|nr:efflux transporter outer membrane subunit [Deltaproteobacteria bacterium]